MLADAITDAFPLRLDIPYSEYWLPLVIGVGVGVLAIGVGRLVLGKGQSGYEPQPMTIQSAQTYDPYLQGSPSEQREHFRRNGNPTEVYFAFPGQKAKPLRGFVVDRSLGGVCMLCAEEVKEGTILAMLPVSAPEMTPWIDVKVCSCRLATDAYEVGCQWVKTPAWSILLMFG